VLIPGRDVCLSLSPPLPRLDNGAGEGLRELNSVLCSEFFCFSRSLCVPLVAGDGERELNSVRWSVFLFSVASPLDRDGERELNSVLCSSSCRGEVPGGVEVERRGERELNWVRCELLLSLSSPTPDMLESCVLLSCCSISICERSVFISSSRVCYKVDEARVRKKT
jgi:hypothetical protein